MPRKTAAARQWNRRPSFECCEARQMLTNDLAGDNLAEETSPIAAVQTSIENADETLIGNEESGPDTPIQEDAPPFQNAVHRQDVNDDGLIAPNDVLAVINAINVRGAGPLPTDVDEPVSRYLDVNGDGLLSPVDILIVVNYINAHGAGPIDPNVDEELMPVTAPSTALHGVFAEWSTDDEEQA